MLEFYKRRKIKSALKRNNRAHAFFNFENLNSVLILFDFHDWDEVYSIAKDLDQTGQKVILWTVKQNKDDKIAPMMMGRNIGNDISLRIILPEELSFFSILKDSVLDEFKSLKYDSLIDFASEYDYVSNYLLANNKAKFCIGIREPEIKIYDFVLLQNEMNLINTYGQIKIYLKNMR